MTRDNIICGGKVGLNLRLSHLAVVRFVLILVVLVTFLVVVLLTLLVVLLVVRTTWARPRGRGSASRERSGGRRRASSAPPPPHTCTQPSVFLPFVYYFRIIFRFIFQLL